MVPPSNQTPPINLRIDTKFIYMLRQRVLVTAVLLPLGLTLIYFGGTAFMLFIALILGLAAWEYAKLFIVGGFQPSGLLVVIGTVAIALGRGINGFESLHWILGIFVLGSMLYHMIAYERGREQAGTDFAITLSGTLYVGLIGAYLISLRDIPNGMWWFMIALPSIWAADSGAYFYGRKFGRRKLSPRLSPKKTLEGYIAGVISGPIIGMAFAYLASSQAAPVAGITPLRGAVLGLVLAVIAPLGDLGESMIKRQFGVKDSSKLLPGHGGAFDRIDSWIWGAIISYYLITWFYI
jgi:phosphatidate cytidylyltransferase